MGIFESITHKQEIESLLSTAQSSYDSSLEAFNKQKKKTTRHLKKLGKVKIRAWANGMDSFVDAFSTFKNVEIHQKQSLEFNFAESFADPEHMLINIQNATTTADEVFKIGAAAIGTGALVGIAAYGGAMMFGSASTGKAIAELKGVAKKNATLSWFGGGSLKTGGLGMAGGKLVLAGIVVAPILAIVGSIAKAKGEEKLAEAREVHAKAMEAVEQMKVMTTGMKAISKVADNYSTFIKKFNLKFKPFIKELNRIKKDHTNATEETIDFNTLSPAEQKTLHISWLMAQIYYHVLSASIMTETGTTSSNASKVLKTANKQTRLMLKDTFILKGEEATAGNPAWAPAAAKVSVFNFLIVAVFIIMGYLRIPNNIADSVFCFIGSIIAFPIFFKYKNLPKNKLVVWRLIRAFAAIIFVFIGHKLFQGSL